MKLLKTRSLVQAALLVFLALLTSCGEESPADCPTFAIGAVEGRVLELGRGVSVEVGARAWEGDAYGVLMASTMADSAGWFRMELSSGLYRLELEPSSAIIRSPDSSDTVRVGSAIHSVDLLRGVGRIRLSMPGALEGQIFSLNLYSDHFPNPFVRDTVRNGLLAMDLPLLQSGEYSMKLNSQSGADAGSFYLPGTLDQNLAASLAVNVTDTTTYTLDFNQEGATIDGTVTGSWQQAGENRPRVHILDAEGRQAGNVQCADDGSFLFHSLYPQQVRLRVGIGFVSRFVGGDSLESATVFDLQPGSAITDISVVESGIRLQLDGPGDLLTHYAALTLKAEDGTRVVDHNYFGTSVPTFGNLAAGRYYLHVDGRRDNEVWAPSWYGGSEDEESAQPIDLAEGQLADLVMELVEGGRIQGEVLNADGTSAGAVVCGLVDAHGEATPHPTYWADGRFLFRGLPDGIVYLGVAQGEQGIWWYPGTWKFEGAYPLEITGHGAITGLKINLPDPGTEVK